MKSTYLNQANANNAAQVYAGGDACARQTGLEEIHSRMRGAVEHMELLIGNLAGGEARLLGGGSIGGKEQATRPQPCGHIGAMSSTLDDLSERISIAQQIANRLAEAI